MMSPFPSAIRSRRGPVLIFERPVPEPRRKKTAAAEIARDCSSHILSVRSMSVFLLFSPVPAIRSRVKKFMDSPSHIRRPLHIFLHCSVLQQIPFRTLLSALIQNVLTYSWPPFLKFVYRNVLAIIKDCQAKVNHPFPKKQIFFCFYFSIFQKNALYGGSSLPPPKSCFSPLIRSTAVPQPASKCAV